MHNSTGGSVAILQNETKKIKIKKSFTAAFLRQQYDISGVSHAPSPPQGFVGP